MSSGTKLAFAAVDWGTSHFRCWLLDSEGKVLAERRSAEGLAAMTESGFEPVLEKHLRDMAAPASLPVVICGMAGSRQGWVEIPYVTLPAKLTAIIDRAVQVRNAARDVRIIPGLAQMGIDAPDVMRGEETQLAGVADLIGEGHHIVCLPGTHSKWVRVEDGGVQAFSTFMTGELFSLLSTKSILRHSIGVNPRISAEHPAFEAALDHALATPSALTAKLFGLRAASLLHAAQPEESAAALSALLIGGEIAAVKSQMRLAPGAIIVLVASGPLRVLYRNSLSRAGFRIAERDAEDAVRAGLFQAGIRLFKTGERHSA